LREFAALLSGRPAIYTRSLQLTPIHTGWKARQTLSEVSAAPICVHQRGSRCYLTGRCEGRTLCKIGIISDYPALDLSRATSRQARRSSVQAFSASEALGGSAATARKQSQLADLEPLTQRDRTARGIEQDLSLPSPPSMKLPQSNKRVSPSVG